MNPFSDIQYLASGSPGPTTYKPRVRVHVNGVIKIPMINTTFSNTSFPSIKKDQSQMQLIVKQNNMKPGVGDYNLDLSF